MNDMTKVIAPKSDQLNSDDLIAGPRTITIRDRDIRPGTEQPVSIYFEGDNGKPWKPCKSMSRVLVAAWGADSREYVGKSLTLYRDPDVTWAGMKVGGIRISHMSHIEREFVMSLTATKKTKSVVTIKVLRVEQQQPETDRAAEWADKFTKAMEAATDRADLEQIAQKEAANLTRLKGQRPELHASCDAVLQRMREHFAAEGPSEDQRGEGPDIANAINDIESAELITDVKAREARWAEQFEGEDREAIHDAAANRIAELERF